MTSSVHVFTSAAVNYLPKVRMLFNSLRQHHPDWTLHLALADALPDDLDRSREPLDAITPADSLGIPDWQGWSFCHAITELATAIKPWMLEHLLALSGEGGKVLYLDPDTVVFSRLDDIIQALRRRAAQHGRSAEAEHREILRESLAKEVSRGSFKSFLASMPAVGDDADFASVRELPRDVSP